MFNYSKRRKLKQNRGDINIVTTYIKDTPVSVALGDHQCAVMSTIIDTTTDVVLNISTSAQMCFVMPKGDQILFFTIERGY